MRQLIERTKATKHHTFLTPFVLLWNDSRRVLPSARMGLLAVHVRAAVLQIGFTAAVRSFWSWTTVPETPKRFDFWIRDIRDYLPEPEVR
jgi:hypothetical protein